MLFKNFIAWLKLPEARQIQSSDDPENIYLLRKIIKRKPFLTKVYESFYLELIEKSQSAPPNGYFTELGSGPGFIKRLAPQIITSDVLPYCNVDMVFSALNIPFEDSSVSAFLMIDVLHHVKESKKFFKEMQRCLKVGGKVVMIEPANTVWSKFIYTKFHHEPFQTDGGWGFEAGGALTGANMAIPWIVFYRDAEVFSKEFPELKICSIRIHTPIRYLLSGGLSTRQLVPSPFYSVACFFEWVISPLNKYVGMFMTIELEKTKSLNTL